MPIKVGEIGGTEWFQKINYSSDGTLVSSAVPISGGTVVAKYTSGANEGKLDRYTSGGLLGLGTPVGILIYGSQKESDKVTDTDLVVSYATHFRAKEDRCIGVDQNVKDTLKLAEFV